MSVFSSRKVKKLLVMRICLLPLKHIREKRSSTVIQSFHTHGSCGNPLGTDDFEKKIDSFVNILILPPFTLSCFITEC